jgi:uncharacterized protein
MTKHGVTFDPDKIGSFCRKWKIREMCLFGSVLREDFGPTSDIDVLIDHDDNAEWDLIDHFHMQDELQEILGRNVDLVDRRAIERSDNRFIRRAVLSNAEPVYAAR